MGPRRGTSTQSPGYAHDADGGNAPKGPRFQYHRCKEMPLLTFCPHARVAYYGTEAGGQAKQRVVPPRRTRHLVEDADLRQLAGVEPYPAELSMRTRPALLQLPVAELRCLLERR